MSFEQLRLAAALCADEGFFPHLAGCVFVTSPSLSFAQELPHGRAKPRPWRTVIGLEQAWDAQTVAHTWVRGGGQGKASRANQKQPGGRGFAELFSGAEMEKKTTNATLRWD